MLFHPHEYFMPLAVFISSKPGGEGEGELFLGGENVSATPPSL